jgi:hypothetical protein
LNDLQELLGIDGLLDSHQAKVIECVIRTGSQRAAAKELGVWESGVRAIIKRARARAAKFHGYAPEAQLNNPIAEGFALQGYSHFAKTINGEPIWLKIKAVEQDYWSGVESALDRIKPIDVKSISPMQGEAQSDIIPWLQIGDAHIGMLASEAETGANFDITIGEAEICAAISALIDKAPKCERFVINDLGDGTHFETFRAMTEASGHPVDFDTRYWKMIDAWVRISEFAIEKALTKADTVDCIYNQGNHSRSNDTWNAATMRAIYRKTDRVNVLRNDSPFIAYRMGKTLVMIHHGDKIKPEGCAKVLATDYAIDWGETTFRYVDGGHVHHSRRIELPGVVFESYNNLAPRDKYANDGGWRSKQCMSLVLRSKRYGEVGREVMPIERVRDLILDNNPSHYVPKDMRAFQA